MGFPYLFMHCCSLLLVVDLGMKGKGVSDLLDFIVSRMRIKTSIYYVTAQVVKYILRTSRMPTWKSVLTKY
jgi:hypothetical protein